MNPSKTAVGLSCGPVGNVPNQKKSFSILEVENGFTVGFSTPDYRYQTHIAQNKEEVIKIISDNI